MPAQQYIITANCPKHFQMRFWWATWAAAALNMREPRHPPIGVAHFCKLSVRPQMELTSISQMKYEKYIKMAAYQT